jgi:hypothetical protein
MWWFGLSLAFAQVEPGCEAEVPVPYVEQVQTDFLQNYVALATTFSAIHAPVPHRPGNGALELEVSLIPPLPCKRRFAMNATKTEDTNKSPILPRPRLSFALPSPFGDDVLVPYGSVGYVPPVRLAGQRSTMVSAEFGLGIQATEGFHLGARFHATAMKTISDAAHSLDNDGVALDLYLANTLGADLMFGWPLGPVTPYASLGLTDASTFFWVGDDGVLVNNLHPYAGPVGAAGVDALFKAVRLAAEFYAAPGGSSLPYKQAGRQAGFGGYGHLYTVRMRVGWEFGTLNDT